MLLCRPFLVFLADSSYFSANLDFEDSWCGLQILVPMPMTDFDPGKCQRQQSMFEFINKTIPDVKPSTEEREGEKQTPQAQSTCFLEHFHGHGAHRITTHHI